jgi:superfamily II DNA helicase RecQ
VHGTSGTRLLYITPEKVARSDVLMRALNQLQQQHRLDRVVVDEAHCVSQVRSSWCSGSYYSAPAEHSPALH